MQCVCGTDGTVRQHHPTQSYMHEDAVVLCDVMGLYLECSDRSTHDVEMCGLGLGVDVIECECYVVCCWCCGVGC